MADKVSQFFRIRMLGSKMFFPLVLLVFVDISKAAPSRLDKVSVQSKQTRVSHIDHFNPAGHVYAAEGQAAIPNADIAGSPSYAPPSNPLPDYELPSTSIIQRVPIQTQPQIVVEKAVSVKSPSRQSSVINHFNPAGHIYEATGQAKIQQQSSSPSRFTITKQTNTYKPPSISQPSIPRENGFKVKKIVTVSQPKRPSGVISHFTPAGHVYEAVGQAEIERIPSGASFSRFQTSQQSYTPPRTIKISPKKSFVTQPIQKDAGFQIQKTVSVKSPSRSSSVINHFNPAGHVYEATGDARIQSGSSLGSRKITTIQKKESYSLPPKAKKTKFLPSKISSSTFQAGGQKRKESGFKLERTVSVKSPVRQSNVISHFTPAGHVYEAVGRAKIEAQPIRSQSQLKISQPLPTYTSPKITAAPKRISQPDFPSISSQDDSSEEFRFTSQPIKKIQQASRFKVEKAVSVKSPTRKVSVIDHFNPAGHVYEATGEAIIQGGSGISSSSNLGSTSTKYTPPAATQPKQPIRKFTTSSSPRIISSVKTDSFRKTRIQSSGSPGLQIEKVVSVKSPQRHSNVISHFTPAGHVYEAVGQAKIAQKPVRTQFSGAQFSQTTSTIARIPNKPKVTYTAPTNKATATSFFGSSATSSKTQEPSKTQKNRVFKETSKSIITPIKESGFKIEKVVSVKSPTRKSTVISHFTPAGHNYEAIGQAKIESIPSSRLRGDILPNYAPPKTSFSPKSIPNQSTNSVFISKTSSPSKPISTRQNIFKTPQTPQITKTITRISSPPSSTSFQSSKQQSIGSGFELKKTVSVKSPVRQSNTISHFTPAGHQYEAVGQAKIIQKPTSQSGSQQSYKPPKITIRKRPIQKVISSDFSLEDTSIVKDPQLTKITTKQTIASVPTKLDASIFSNSQQFIQTSPKIKKIQSFSSSSQGSHVSGFDIRKKVSVKSPAQTSSTISHFTPAGHVYEATGEATLQGQSAGGSASRTQFSQSTSITKGGSIKQPSPTYVEPSIPKITKITKKVQTFTSPSKANFAAELETGSALELKKKVSVKSPTLTSNTINHFTPAGHVYEATGQATIIGGSQIQEKGPSESPSRGGSVIFSHPIFKKEEQGDEEEEDSFENISIKFTEEDSEEDSDESEEQRASFDFSKPENIFSSGDFLGSYLPPSSDYKPPSGSFSAGLLPPQK